jgi:hypothetical protein
LEEGVNQGQLRKDPKFIGVRRSNERGYSIKKFSRPSIEGELITND